MPDFPDLDLTSQSPTPTPSTLGDPVEPTQEPGLTVDSNSNLQLKDTMPTATVTWPTGTTT
jgi:hypothetical protein